MSEKTQTEGVIRISNNVLASFSDNHDINAFLLKRGVPMEMSIGGFRPRKDVLIKRYNNDKLDECVIEWTLEMPDEKI